MANQSTSKMAAMLDKQRQHMDVHLACETDKIDELDGVMIKESPGATTCLFSFGSIGNMGGVIIPGFEFIKSTNGLPTHRIFFRDIGSSWYISGLRKHCTTFAGIGDVIQKILDKYQPTVTIFVGNSGGGLPAIFYGNWFKANGVLCFVPTTFFTTELRDKYGEDRVKQAEKRSRILLSQQKLHSGFEGVFCDFSKIPLNPDTHFELHYDKNYAYDVAHADHFPNGPKIRKVGWEFDSYHHTHPHKGHHVDIELKRRGRLKEVFKQFFEKANG